MALMAGSPAAAFAGKPSDPLHPEEVGRAVGRAAAQERRHRVTERARPAGG